MRLEMQLTSICALLALSACNMEDATSPVGTRNLLGYDFTARRYQLVSRTNWGHVEISSSRVVGSGGEDALGSLAYFSQYAMGMN
jgi:hypothetical protein